MGMKTFATSQYHESVLNVRRFMFDDIDKTIGLADNPNVGAPNFLLALALDRVVALFLLLSNRHTSIFIVTLLGTMQ
jgi:hypothetical protein